MMRLPRFHYRAPETIVEAAAILAGEGPEAAVLAGGTDLLPNMKRRQRTPRTLVGLRHVFELKRIRDGGGLSLGAGVTLDEVAESEPVRRRFTGLWQATAQIATPHIRHMGTVGGNLCIDTRCNYYDQSYDWRKSIDFCLKKDGEVCWVAPSSRRCLAVSSTDLAPALVSLGARVRLVSARDGERVLPLTDLYRNDGIQYLAKRPDEILTDVLLDPPDGRRSAYWKLRRRGSFDFPVLSVAAAARIGKDGAVEDARVVIGAVASRPMESKEAGESLAGKKLTDEAIEEAADLAYKVAKPMDNTDFVLHWRKRVSRDFVRYALRELRGDDMRKERARFARHSLEPVGTGPA